MYGDKILLTSHWANDSGHDVFSNKDYMAYELMAARLESTYDGELRTDRAVGLRLYVDCDNGIVVYDIAEYEKSLGLEPEKREAW
jgi:hypothetical protein